MLSPFFLKIIFQYYLVVACKLTVQLVAPALLYVQLFRFLPPYLAKAI